MTPKTALATTLEPRLTLEAKARLLVEIREQLKRLEAEARQVREDLVLALIDHNAEPLQAGPYTVTLVTPKPRKSLDERKLLEAGVSTAQLARGTVEKAVTPYPDVRLSKESSDV